MNDIDKLREIILENNYFDTLAGERFRDWNNIDDIKAVIAFAGRSRTRRCYRLSSDSDSDQVYVTHLYIDRSGDIMVQLASEDTDDFGVLLHTSGEPIENYDDDTIEEWVKLLTF